MAAAKSAHLLMTGYNLEDHEWTVFYMKSNVDTRDPGVITSRAGLQHKCIVFDDTLDQFEIISNYCRERTAILIDECQFLTEEQVESLCSIADDFNVLVICYGLRTDSTTRLFPGSRRLFELADEFEEIKSSCYCGHKTLFNAKVDSNGNIIKTASDQIDIGGDDKYVAVCRSCYNEGNI